MAEGARPLDRSTGRRTAGRPPSIDADRIAAAALAEIDGLTLSAVARRLGVAKSALYHHVAGRDELVALAAQQALATLRRPDPDLPWEAFVVDFVHSVRDCLLQHPGLDLVLLELHDAPPAFWELMRWVIGVLADAGIEEGTAATAVPLLATTAHDAARHQRAAEERGVVWPHAWLERRVTLVIDGMRTRLVR